MTDEEYQKKKLIKNILDNPLFEVVLRDARVEIGLLMLEASEETKRAEFYSLNKALDRLVGHLTAIANEVRAEDG